MTLNDSKNPFESHKDRHEKIGEGTVVTIEEIRGVKLIVKQNKED